MGVVYFARVSPELDDVIRAADEAMYEAKRAGKGRTVLREMTPAEPARRAPESAGRETQA